MNLFGKRRINSVNSSIEINKNITGSTLKIIAIVTMLIDNIGAIVLNRMLSTRGLEEITEDNVAHFFETNGDLFLIFIITRMIGRLAFPIFAFLLIEGFVHTRSVLKYALRLLAFAIVSEIPFDLAFEGKFFYLQYQNVFFTLLIGLLVMAGIKKVSDGVIGMRLLTAVSIIGVVSGGYALVDSAPGIIDLIYKRFIEVQDTIVSRDGFKIILIISISLILLFVYVFLVKKYTMQKANKWFSIIAVTIIGMYIASFLKTDYSGFGILTIVIMYGFRRSHTKSMLSGCIALTVMSIIEFPAFSNLLFIRRYNGERGLKLKYLFYAFYPIHLLVLYLISIIIGIA